MNDCAEQVTEEDDVPQLSAHTLAILQEFYSEQAAVEQCCPLPDVDSTTGHTEQASMPREDWQLSQFWYDDRTATILAQEAIAVAKQNGRIACISCPTLYRRLLDLKSPSCTAVCLEYDTRFQIFGDDFIEYDYNRPLDLPPGLEGSFDIVIADPPFLSEECLRKTASTVRHLAKKNVVLCTGAIMTDVAAELLGVRQTRFHPGHANNLANEFRCFVNYDTLVIDKCEPE